MTLSTIAYRAGWLIDGSGRPAARNRIITIQAGRIQQVIDGNRECDPELTVIDLAGATVFPALVDSHVHLAMSGSTEPNVRRDQLDGAFADRSRVIADHLREHLQYGVLAVRDGGDHHGHSLRYRMNPCSESALVTVAAPGRARHAPGRYGKLIGIAVEPGMTLAQSAFDRASSRDHLKLVNSGLNSLTQFGIESPAQFGRAELAAAVMAARSRNLPVMVHANGYLPVKLAVDAGCDSIEHGFFMGRENMRRMADRGVVWVPTAVTMKAYTDFLETQGHRSDPSFADVSRRNLEHQLEQIGLARQLGVTLALGTDAGSPGVHHGHAVKAELALFIAAGFSVEEAVRCASRNGARLMGLRDRGEIAPGMRADFMAVEAPPEQLPEVLHRISLRVARGREIDLGDTGER
ncbi:MAG TPA: amidohydrolase family protein [Desulfosarcina sp.]|nr:amidohydrolase family protein [Desulfosarcina sp.]